jgi:predicted peptidase
MYEEVFKRADGSVLRYTISIPRGYDKDQPRPLVLALHYAGEVTPYYGKGLLNQLVEPGLRHLGAILVAPDCPSRGWDNPESEKQVMALIEHILENYSIDRERILVTGYSMGGRGTWYMASRYPDLFTAAIPMAGWPSDKMVDEIGNMPLCIIHSSDDEVVSMEPTSKAVKALEARGAPVELITVRGVTHYQVPGFTKYLEKAARWVEKRWNK